MPKGVYSRGTVKERFEKKVKVVESGCHEWQSTIMHRDGYGKFWHKTGQVQAHRMSYMLHKGDIPDGLWVLHKCDNRKCVNPDHLYLGTAKDNTRDMFDRGRAIGNTRYSKELVQKAISLYEEGLTQQQVADKLGIHQVTISKYVRKVQRRFST